MTKYFIIFVRKTDCNNKKIPNSLARDFFFIEYVLLF